MMAMSKFQRAKMMVQCPFCHAEPGKHCVLKSGYAPTSVHNERLRAYTDLERRVSVAMVTDELREEFDKQEFSYRSSGMEVSNKDRAELVVRFMSSRGFGR